MKKLFVLAIAILVLAGSVRAGTLTLVKPNGGETWAPGSDRLILWTAVGISGNVKLVLYRNGARLGRIAAGLSAGAGSCDWIAGQYEGGTAPEGDGYTIRVQTVDDSLTDSSDAPFAIGATATPGGTGQTVTKLSDRKVQLAKADLAKATIQQPHLALKILHVDRIEPAVLLNTIGSSGSAFGQGFNASQPVRTNLVAETVSYSQQFKLNVTAWSDGRIDFTRNQMMTPGDYLVYLGFEQPGGYDPISNKVPLRIEASEYSYINFVQPGSIVTGEAEHPIEIHGLGFNKPHDSRGATVWFNGIPRPVSVVSWSDGLVHGHFSTLLIPAATKCEIVVHHIKDGVTRYSNRATFYVNPR
jgi:hypothetical protein